MKHTIAAVCNYQGNVFFFDNELQTLCEFSVDSESVKAIAINEGSYFFAFHIFSYGNYLYIAERRMLDFLRYDFNSGSLSRVYGIAEKNLGLSVYDYHMMSENKLWSFPNNLEMPIYYYDMNEEVFKKDECEFNYDGETITRFSSGYNNIYWRAFYNTNKFIKYNLEKKEILLYEVSDSSVHINAICFDGTNVWVTSADNSSIIKCTESGKILDIFDAGGKHGNFTFSRLYNYDSYIVGLPYYGDYILFIDKNQNTLKKIVLRDLDANFDIDTKGSKILGCLKSGDKFILFGFHLDGIIITDKDGSNARNIPLLFTKEDLNRIINAYVKRSPIVVEGGEKTLSELLSVVSDEAYEIEKVNEHSKLQTGKALFEQIKKELDAK